MVRLTVVSLFLGASLVLAPTSLVAMHVPHENSAPSMSASPQTHNAPSADELISLHAKVELLTSHLTVSIKKICTRLEALEDEMVDLDQIVAHGNDASDDIGRMVVYLCSELHALQEKIDAMTHELHAITRQQALMAATSYQEDHAYEHSVSDESVTTT